MDKFPIESAFDFRKKFKEKINLQSLLKKYKELLEIDFVPINADNNKEVYLKKWIMCHVLWMIQEMELMVTNAYDSLIHDLSKEDAQQQVEKIYRWLGYIQGVLSSYGFYTIEELKEQNNSVFKSL